MPDPHPRVDHAVQQVDDQVDHHVDHADDQPHPHHAGQVEVGRRLVGVGAHAGPREDLLHQHGAREQRAERQPHHGQDRDERGPQHVAQQHRATGQALRPGRAHVVLVEHLQHGRAGEPRQQPDGVERQHQGRQHEVRDGVGERRPLPGQQGVHRVEAGHSGGRGVGGREPSGARREVELVGEDVERDHRQPERRHGDAHHRHQAQRAVGEVPAPHGRDDPEADADEDRRHDRADGDLQGRGHRGGQVRDHRAVRLLGLAEVTVHEVGEVGQVLRGQRPVEPVVGAVGRHDRRVGRGLLPQVRRHRVAGHEVRQHERHQRDADDEQHRDPDAPQHVPDQRVARRGRVVVLLDEPLGATWLRWCRHRPSRSGCTRRPSPTSP